MIRVSNFEYEEGTKLGGALNLRGGGSGKQKYLILTGILAILYYLAAHLGLKLDAVGGFAAFVWPPTGIAVSFVLLFGPAVWPGIFVGASIVNFVHGAPWPAALGIGVGNTLEALLALNLLHRNFRFRHNLQRRRDVLAFILVAGFVAPIVSASIGVTSLFLVGTFPPPMVSKVWGAWWLGDFLGVLVVAPLFLVWSDRRWIMSRGIRSFEALVLGCTLASLTFVVCGGVTASVDRYALEYTLFPALIWAAMRFGVKGTVTSIFLVASITLGCTAIGMGPFARASMSDSLFSAQLFLGVLAVSSLILAAAVQELTRSQAAVVESRQRAESASLAKSHFLAAMSHEIRTPLGAIIGFAELLKDQVLSKEDRERYTEIIERNGRELSRLIDDILDLSKVEAGKLEVKFSNLNIRDLVNDVVNLLSQKAQSQKVRLSVNWASGTPESIYSDQMRLRQIIINIVGNAIKFSAGGSVTIHIRPSEDPVTSGVTFLIQDTGQGIAEDEQKRLFRPFTQTEAGAVPGQKGTGLGLFLSKRLAHALGAQLELVESIPSRGTTFALRVPCGKSVSVFPEKQSSPTTNDFQGVSILLAEDSEDLRVLVERMLSLRGANVESVKNGKDAVEQVLQKKYDVVLMDLQMPVLDGFEATAQLRGKGIETPIIALTAHAMNEDRERCISAGFTGHVPKPIRPGELMRTIASCIEGAGWYH